jgi:hypothetical protein
MSTQRITSKDQGNGWSLVKVLNHTNTVIDTFKVRNGVELLTRIDARVEGKWSWGLVGNGYWVGLPVLSRTF